MGERESDSDRALSNGSDSVELRYESTPCMAGVREAAPVRELRSACSLLAHRPALDVLNDDVRHDDAFFAVDHTPLYTGALLSERARIRGQQVEGAQSREV